MKMYGSLSDEDLNEWERLPSVMRVLCSAQMGAWLLRRDENKEKSEHKTGRWIPLEYDGYADGNPVWDKWECSKCGWEHSGDEESLTAFCPNCGTRMEVEE